MKNPPVACTARTRKARLGFFIPPGLSIASMWASGLTAASRLTEKGMGTNGTFLTSTASSKTRAWPQFCPFSRQAPLKKLKKKGYRLESFARLPYLRMPLRQRPSRKDMRHAGPPVTGHREKCVTPRMHLRLSDQVVHRRFGPTRRRSCTPQHRCGSLHRGLHPPRARGHRRHEAFFPP
jgi:hypothetical protein